MPDGIEFHNIHHELTLSDLCTDEVGHNDNVSYISDNDWKDQMKPERDVNLVADMDINDDELEDIDDLGDEDKRHLNDGSADNKCIADNGVQHKHKNQHNNFGGPNNYLSLWVCV